MIRSICRELANGVGFAVILRRCEDVKLELLLFYDCRVRSAM